MQSTYTQGSISSINSGSSPTKRAPICRCHELCILRTVGKGENRGKVFWGCVNYKDEKDKGCNHFRWFGDDVIDDRDYKIYQQKKKIGMLKEELCKKNEEIGVLKQEVFMLKNDLREALKNHRIFSVVGLFVSGFVVFIVVRVLCFGRIGSLYLN